MDADREIPEPSSSHFYEDCNSDSSDCHASHWSTYERNVFEAQSSRREANSIKKNQNLSEAGPSTRPASSLWMGNEAEPGPSRRSDYISKTEKKRKHDEDQACSSSSNQTSNKQISKFKRKKENDDGVSSQSSSFSLFSIPTTSHSRQAYNMAVAPVDSSDSELEEDVTFRSIPYARSFNEGDEAEALAVDSTVYMPMKSISRFDSDMCMVSSSTGAIDSSSLCEDLSPRHMRLGLSSSGVGSTSEVHMAPLFYDPDEERISSPDLSRVECEKPSKQLDKEVAFVVSSKADSMLHNIQQAKTLFKSKSKGGKITENTFPKISRPSSSSIPDLLAVAGPSGINQKLDTSKKEKLVEALHLSRDVNPLSQEDQNEDLHSSGDSQEIMHCVPEFVVAFPQDTEGLKGFSSVNKSLANMHEQSYLLDLDEAFHLDDGLSKNSDDIDRAIENLDTLDDKSSDKHENDQCSFKATVKPYQFSGTGTMESTIELVPSEAITGALDNSDCSPALKQSSLNPVSIECNSHELNMGSAVTVKENRYCLWSSAGSSVPVIEAKHLKNPNCFSISDGPGSGPLLEEDPEPPPQQHKTPEAMDLQLNNNNIQLNEEVDGQSPCLLDLQRLVPLAQTTENNERKSDFLQSDQNVIFVPTQHLEQETVEDSTESEQYWCGECEEFLAGECLDHVVYTIADKRVMSRPWASLPAQYVAIQQDKTDECHVIAKKTIDKRILFGPLEGNFVHVDPRENHFKFPIKMSSGNCGYLDTSDDAFCNWMKYVRPAETALQMNCAVVQDDNKLYFITTESIRPKDELRVGYSKQYATKYNLIHLCPTQPNKEVLESSVKTWQCLESDKLEQLHTHPQKRLPTPIQSKRQMKKTLSNAPKQLIKEEANDIGNNQVETARKSYDCGLCRLSFPTAQLVYMHAGAHSPAVDEEHLAMKTCPSCSSEFASNDLLVKHVASHSLNKVVNLFKCDLCYKSFVNERKLQTHRLSHSKDADKQYQCHLCHRRFCNKAALTSHLKFHAGESVQAYTCPICKNNFGSVISLKSHIVVHRVNDQYTCPLCNKCFPLYSKIRRHIRAYHPDKCEMCEKCGKEFASVEKLRIHSLIHSDQRNFQCSLCPKSFKRKDKMKEHQKRLHSGQGKPPKISTAKTAVHKDVELYTFKCLLCSLGFKRRGMLVNHMNNKHPEVSLESIPELNQPILKECRLYYCQYCEKCYGTRMRRKQHIEKHHPGLDVTPPETEAGHKNYNSVMINPKEAYAVSCHLCPRQYVSNAKLLQHQRKNHPQQPQQEATKAAAKLTDFDLDSQAIFALVTEDESEPYCITLPASQLISRVAVSPSEELVLDKKSPLLGASSRSTDSVPEGSSSSWACLDNLSNTSQIWQ